MFFSSSGDVDAPVWRRCRIWLSVLAFFGFIFLYSQRVGMSVAIVCMVNQTAVRDYKSAEDLQDPTYNVTGANGVG